MFRIPSTNGNNKPMKEIFLSDHLKNKEDEQAQWVKYNFLFGVICLLAGGILSTVNAAFFVFGIIGTIVFFISGAAQAKKSHITKQGVIGEEILKKQLRSILPDEYTAIYNIPVNGEDINCFVMGPHGVYAFEVKHYNGVISYTERWPGLFRQPEAVFK